MGDTTTYHLYTPEENRNLLSGALEVFGTCWRRRELMLVLTKRDIQARYKGSLLGVLWSFLSPMMMLAVYTFVFAFLFKAKWEGIPDGIGSFTIMLFCGMLPFQFFSEALSRSAMAIVSSPNYVKKVAFPVELLSIVTVGTAMIHLLISMVILLGGMLLLQGHIPLTIFWAPIVGMPLFLVTIAFALAVSALGVFIRDLTHGLTVLLTMLMFATPIFYSPSLVPERFLFLVKLNPVAYTVTGLRRVCVQGWPPEWDGWMYCMAGGVVLLVLAAGWFNIVRGRLSDVL